jgi:transcriptional regulator with XRE-family HTH domain
MILYPSVSPRSAELGDRLAKARERAGFSQDDVALLVGQQRPVISNWESGTRTPKVELLEQLAAIYRVSLAALLGEEPVEERPSFERLLFRDANERLGPAAKQEIQRFLAFLDAYGEFLDNLGEPAGLNKSPFSIGSGFSTREDVRRRAQLAREFLGLGDGPVGDLKSLVDLAGITVCVGALGSDLATAVSGVFVPHPRVGFSIVVNGQTTPGRQLFTLAHELAHALFHGDRQYVGYFGRREAHERFADAFAAEFLVPSQSLRSVVEKFGVSKVTDAEIVVHLQRIFQVSYATMLVRLRSAELIRAEDFQSLQDARPVHLAMQLGYSVTQDEWHQDPEAWGLLRFPQRFLRLLRRELLADNISVGTAARLTSLAHEDVLDLIKSQSPHANDAADIEYLAAFA